MTLSQLKHSIWFIRNPKELQALRDADAKAGHFLDDGGEPILYGVYAGWNAIDVKRLTVTAVRARNITWQHWSRRPKGLRAGFCKRLGREVLFLAKSVKVQSRTW